MKEILRNLPGKINAAMAAKILPLSFALVIIGYLLLTDYGYAQTVNIDFGAQGDGVTTSKILQVVALITILSVAPSILIMVTSFVRIIVVLSLLRSALGVQQTPPNPVLVSLALFLTAFIMQPVFEKAYNDGIVPLMEQKIDEKAAFTKVVEPFHEFMMAHVREQDLSLFLEMAGNLKVENPKDTPLRVLIPAFMISELKRSFEIGFLVFIPFLVIDMVIASTLMSMGMMMLPPVLISLPFKLVFFVLVDGWHMISSSLVKSFEVAG